MTPYLPDDSEQFDADGDRWVLLDTDWFDALEVQDDLFARGAYDDDGAAS